MASRTLRIITPLAGTVAAMAMGVPATAAVAGGTPAPSASGGLEFGAVVPRPRRAARPVATLFRVSPERVTAGATPPRVVVRIDQRGVRVVRARVVFWPLRGSGRVLRIDLGRVQTGRRVEARWPAGASLSAGRYVVRLHARGPGGGRLMRRGARSAGRAPLTVRPAPPPPAPPRPAPLTPITPGAVFPVAGPHSYGGDDARFGAARGGHAHEGQDIAADEGTRVVAPLAGTITARDYQADGAGFYLVQHAVDGRHFFFAHCQKDTFAVAVGDAVRGGQQLCRVGSTGRSSGPHLHFEIWVGGWRAGEGSRAIDPLPDLQAWDAPAVTG